MAREHTRGIAVVDIGYTNSKVILYDASLKVLGERKHASFHKTGAHYREIDAGAAVAFAGRALQELDTIAPVDTIVTTSHGACIVTIGDDGKPVLPAMDYMSEPPPEIAALYARVMPPYAESYSPALPMALLHGLQLFWQKRILPDAFARATAILPLMQYVGLGLGGRAVTEVSAMSCQSHLVDMRTGAPSSLAKAEGWDRLYAPMAKAWDVIGTLKPEFRGASFRGRGDILAGVHDSNANYLRYLAGGLGKFTLLSTGTWIIGFDTEADIARLDPARDLVANKDVFGRTVASCRFFGGKEFEMLSGGAPPETASRAVVEKLIQQDTFAVPSFSDSGGPMPGTGGKGRIEGPPPVTDAERASLASLYCALMVSESLDAIGSAHRVIIDGPFTQNDAFLSVLAALRPEQPVFASELTDGTATGAACLALMPDGLLPRIDIAMREISAQGLAVKAYQARWRQKGQST